LLRYRSAIFSNHIRRPFCAAFSYKAETQPPPAVLAVGAGEKGSNPHAPFSPALPQKNKSPKQRKNPGNPPLANRQVKPHYKAPWEVYRHTPTQSRATFEISELGYRNSGVPYPPPLSRTTPLTKKSGWLCSLRFATVAKPSWCAKGGEHPIARRQWGEK